MPDPNPGASPPPPAPSRCWRCGAAVDPASAALTKCGNCGANLTAVGATPELLTPEGDNPYAAPRAEIGTARRVSPGLVASWVAGVGAVVVALAWAPGLGVLLVFVVPALIRTIVGARRRGYAEAPGPAGGYVTLFLSSLGIAFVTIVSASVAFVVTCFPLALAGFSTSNNSNSPLFVLAWVVGFVAAGAVVWFWGKRIWPLRDNP